MRHHLLVYTHFYNSEKLKLIHKRFYFSFSKKGQWSRREAHLERQDFILQENMKEGGKNLLTPIKNFSSLM